MKTWHILAAAVIIGTTAAPASAQTIDVRPGGDIRIRIDTQAIREASEEIREAMREAFGPHTRLELQREIGSFTRELADAIQDLSRDLSRDLGRELGRDFGRELRGAFQWNAGESWQRNFPASQTDTEKRTFAIGAAGEFDLENLSGDIRIVAGTGRDLTIEITRRARGRNEAEARNGLSRVRVETTHRGDRVTAKTVYPNERQSNYSVSVDYVVTAPAGTRVTARTLSGDISATAITGELSLNTMSGDVTVTQATHLLSAKTASGDIVLREVSAEGALDASTMSGDVTATMVKARRLNLTTISGTVTARGAQSSDVKLNSTSGNVVFDGDLAANGRYTFTSHSGNVQLTLDGRTGFTFESSTFTGTVRTDLPLQVNSLGATGRRPARNLRGTFGDGSAMVTATSFSGNVVVLKR